MKTAPLIGGPMDGKCTDHPGDDAEPRNGEGKARVFGDHIYAWVRLGGVLAWHYSGKVKWTLEETERRRLAIK